MADRPKLSLVAGGKITRQPEAAIAPGRPSLETQLKVELRVLRERNAGLTLELGASHAGAARAAHRQQDLASQLQLERDDRRRLERQLRERNADVVALRSDLAQQTARYIDLGRRAGQFRDFVVGVWNALGEKPSAEDLATADLGSVRERIKRLKEAYLAAKITVSASMQETSATRKDLADVSARHAVMSENAESVSRQLSTQASELATLRDIAVRSAQAIAVLQTSLTERDRASALMRQHNADLSSERVALKSRVSLLELQLTQAHSQLSAATGKAAENNAELAQMRDASLALQLRIEMAEHETARRARAEQSLRTELSELSAQLDERRHLVRQLQQERALVKLHRNRRTRKA